MALVKYKCTLLLLLLLFARMFAHSIHIYIQDLLHIYFYLFANFFTHFVHIYLQVCLHILFVFICKIVYIFGQIVCIFRKAICKHTSSAIQLQ